MSSPELAPPHHRLELLYTDHHSWLLGWLRRKTGCGHQAADMAQETFVSVLTAGEGNTAEQIREPRPFLATIARRVVAHHRRRQALENSYLEWLAALPEAHAPSPEVQLQSVQMLQEVDRVLDALPAKVKEAFLLAHLDALSYADIAQRLGVSASSVKQYLTRANRQCLFAISLDW